MLRDAPVSYRGIGCARGDDGKYLVEKCQGAWQIWQAACAATAPAEEMIRFCPECGRLGDIPAGYDACCPDWSQARIVPKRFEELCAEAFRLCVSQPFPQSAAAPAVRRPASFEAWCDRFPEISAVDRLRDAWQAARAAAPAAPVQRNDHICLDGEDCCPA
ncbi:hypothetical protein [Burkholderia multivorans]|uniref:hypothetical protein n=2 Tax=Burkholderia multivorans TaxID=87883 RepID=UPI001E3B9329|nr:hypothetical protein [Burkholderia multivorans]